MASHFLETENVYLNRVYSIRLVIFFNNILGHCFADIRCPLIKRNQCFARVNYDGCCLIPRY